MARYCPLCGEPEGKKRFLGELCLDCAKSRIPPFPQLKITRCKRCGFLVDKARKRKEASLGEEVLRLLKLQRKGASFDEEKGEVEYELAGEKIRLPVKVSLSEAACNVCSRAASQYFEAIIQLRGNGRKAQKMAGLLAARIERKSFVPKIERLKEGIDIYCGSRSEAIAALNSFGLGFVRTEKLAGQREGRRLYRTTLLVRL
ncbi:MAG: 60S ribosomal export protein NMD3 [Candidatus Micrarchaeota archaeon]|nr:60S ribosomal export protein NMD3 [Candidatus Micrarchaeota archaeon]